MRSGSFANHSCVPNARMELSGGKAIMRILKPLKAGDEIVISYIDAQKSR